MLQGNFGVAVILKVCILASSSSGNATFVRAGDTRLLIDTGLSRKELCARLDAIGERPDQIDAVLITHEHSDHISGLVRWIRGFNTPIYTTERTAPIIDWQGESPRLTTFPSGASLRIGSIDIDSFTVPHDATDPVGYLFRAEGVKVGLCTDLGYIPDSIRFHLRGADMLVLESNHDLEMLKVGPYPWSLKQRVMGRNGHLSNDVVGEFIGGALDSTVHTLVLSHLSKNNNHPELARLVASQALENRGHRAKLVVAEPGKQSETFIF